MCPSLPSGSGPPRRAPLRQCGSAVGAADCRARGRQEQWEPLGYFSRGGVPRQQGRARHAGAGRGRGPRREEGRKDGHAATIARRDPGGSAARPGRALCVPPLAGSHWQVGPSSAWSGVAGSETSRTGGRQCAGGNGRRVGVAGWSHRPRCWFGRSSAKPACSGKWIGSWRLTAVWIGAASGHFTVSLSLVPGTRATIATPPGILTGARTTGADDIWYLDEEN